jgi:DNA repair protein RadC
LTDLTDDCWKIAARMLNDTPVAELDALTATADERDFETVAQHVREAIDKNQPEAALDRLHTFVIKYLRPTMAHDLFSFDSSVLLVRDVAGDYRPADADEVLQAAQRLLGQQLRGLEVLSSPQVVRDFLRVKLGSLEHEVFAVLMLDAQHRLIEYVELFHGMVSQTSVYPREVVKESQARNVAALVLAHNHPSGVAEPSLADEHLTQTLKSALSLVDVRLLDHAMAAGRDVRSLAELDLLRPVNAVNGVRQ